MGLAAAPGAKAVVSGVTWWGAAPSATWTFLRAFFFAMWLFHRSYGRRHSGRRPLSPGAISHVATRVRPRSAVTYNASHSMRGGGQRNCAAGNPVAPKVQEAGPGHGRQG